MRLHLQELVLCTSVFWQDGEMASGCSDELFANVETGSLGLASENGNRTLRNETDERTKEELQVR
jgi:hypothetical protein